MQIIDVYKRQEEDDAKEDKKKSGLEILKMHGIMSYADVYKRQGKIERRLNIFVIYSFCKMRSQVNRKLLVAYGVLQCRLICRL